MKKACTIFGAIMLVALIGTAMDEAKACSEIFISTNSKVNISARNFDFLTTGRRFSLTNSTY